MPVGLLVVSAVITRGPNNDKDDDGKPTTIDLSFGKETIPIDVQSMIGLIDDDGLVATAAVGEVVSGRLFVHDQCDVDCCIR